MNVTFVDSYTGLTLAQAQSKKIDELKTKCAEVIQGGFTSSALGTAHTYPSDPTSMIYFNATYNRFNADATFTSVDWQTTDAGYLTHTKAQFQQAFHDGHDFGIQQEEHMKQLVANVMTAPDVPSVKAISW